MAAEANPKSIDCILLTKDRSFVCADHLSLWLTIVSFTGVPTVVPSTVTVDSGQSVTLLCSASGNPAPTFSWFKGETQLLNSDPRLSITGGTLTISGIVVDDRGYYTCRATFSAGTTEARAYVSVRCELMY
jgi:hypothetical protein